MRLNTIKLPMIAAGLAAAAVFYFNPLSVRSVELSADYRTIPRPESYGSIKMNRTGKPAVFNHISHRDKYACSVCHTDLGFPLKANAIEIRQADIEAGKYCAKCHDGKAAFGVSDCARCHQEAGAEPSKKLLDALKGLPGDHFGNQVNWVEAAKQGKIKPAASLDGKADRKALDRDIVIPAAKFKPSPPDVMFRHRPHTELLDCSSCHPAPFKDKANGNPEMSMIKIISGQYCGTCHGRVSFPLNDCFRCHSQPVPPMEDVKIDKDKPAAEPAKK